jgi:hypothetical protein
MKPSSFMFLCTLLVSCVIHHDQRQLVSRNKSQVPIWADLPEASWRQNLDQEVFLFRGQSAENLTEAIKLVESKANRAAVGDLGGWMHESLHRFGLLDALDASENLRLKTIIETVSDQEFGRYTYVRDVYFEEYAVISPTSTKNEIVAYILLGLPPEARSIAFNRLSSRLNQEKSSKFGQLAVQIQRSSELMTKRVAH